MVFTVIIVVVVDEDDWEIRLGDFGYELRNRKGEDRFGIGDLFGDFSGRVERISGGDYGAERHHGETYDGEED